MIGKNYTIPKINRKLKLSILIIAKDFYYTIPKINRKLKSSTHKPRQESYYTIPKINRKLNNQNLFYFIQYMLCQLGYEKFIESHSVK